MSTFNSTKRYEVSSSFIPSAVEAIKNAFEKEGFTFEKKPGTVGETVIEVTKGNLVKKVVGLRQGLQISFVYDGSTVSVEAKGIVLKNQLIPTAITLFVTWPVLIPQIIGLIKQSKLDKKAIAVVDAAFSEYENEKPVFCTNCGSKVSGEHTHCPNCGSTL